MSQVLHSSLCTPWSFLHVAFVSDGITQQRGIFSDLGLRKVDHGSAHLVVPLPEDLSFRPELKSPRLAKDRRVTARISSSAGSTCQALELPLHGDLVCCNLVAP